MITLFLGSSFSAHRKEGSVLITTVCCLVVTLSTLVGSSDTGVADSCINLPSAVLSKSCTSSPLMDL